MSSSSTPTLLLLAWYSASVHALSVPGKPVRKNVLENALIDLCATQAPEQQILRCVAELQAESTLAEVVPADRLNGNWRLLRTSRSDFDWRNPLGRRTDGSTPGLEGFLASITGSTPAPTPSSSPIQRAVTDAFTVTQDIRSVVAIESGRVEQAVKTPLGVLHLNAAAKYDPASASRRINFAFDEGYFEFRQAGLPRLPYPVPFRLLGKEAEGWIDTSYLSDRLRISTGNKGTTFILEREAQGEPN
jgi:hypothetical protein